MSFDLLISISTIRIYLINYVNMKNEEIRKKVYSTTRWQKTSKWIRRTQPLCCDKFNLHPGIDKSTAHVHHVIPIIYAPKLAYAKINLVPLCEECHQHTEELYAKGDMKTISASALGLLAAEVFDDANHLFDTILFNLLDFHPEKGVFDLKICQNLSNNRVFCVKMNKKRNFKCAGCAH